MRFGGGGMKCTSYGVYGKLNTCSYESMVGWIWFDWSINGVSTAKLPTGYY